MKRNERRDNRMKTLNENIIEQLQSKHDAYLGTKGEENRQAFKNGLAWAIDTIETLTYIDKCEKEHEAEQLNLHGVSNSDKFRIKQTGVNELIEDYQRKINSVNELLKNKDNDKETINRLKIKAGCYRSFLTDLNRALNIDDVSKCSVCDSPPIEVERVLDNEIVDFCLKCRKEI